MTTLPLPPDELLTTTRSVRKRLDLTRPVPLELVRECLEVALQALSRFQRLDAGDLLLTGTPEGTALSAPPKPVAFIAALLPPALKWKLFFRRQAQNPKYLKVGDVVELAIGTDDGAIGLGRQHTVVGSAPDE